MERTAYETRIQQIQESHQADAERWDTETSEMQRALADSTNARSQVTTRLEQEMTRISEVMKSMKQQSDTVISSLQEQLSQVKVDCETFRTERDVAATSQAQLQAKNDEIRASSTDTEEKLKKLAIVYKQQQTKLAALTAKLEEVKNSETSADQGLANSQQQIAQVGLLTHFNHF
jgi:chromosome segregation ATPase